MQHKKNSTSLVQSEQAPLDIRLRLLHNGYDPLPANGKAVKLEGWDEIKPTEADIKNWSKTRPDDRNTGIRTGNGIVGVDIDVLHSEISNQLAMELEKHTRGELYPPVRFGRRPKCLLLMRVDEDGPKMTTAEYFDANGEKVAQVEVLAQGQQFIAHGIHPDTLNPYDWPDGCPLTVPIYELPTITRKRLWDFLREATAEFDAMVADGHWTVKEQKGNRGGGGGQGKSGEPLERVLDALKAIPNDGEGVSWDTWNAIAMALHEEFEGSENGLEAFLEWSAQSKKHRAHECKRKWRSFEFGTEGNIGGGTIMSIARQHGWEETQPEDFEDGEDADLLPAKRKGKHKSLMADPKGRMLNNLANAAHWLRTNEAFGGMLAFDEMQMEAVIRQPSGEVLPLHDHQITALAEIMQRYGMKEMSSAKVAEAAALVAREHPFHPVRDWLRRLTWDGRKRMSTWLPDYLGTSDTDYTRAVGRMFLIAMVARVMRPGAKVDHMLILQGDQGVGKSSVARLLAGIQHFSDDLPPMNAGKDLLQHLRGKWLIEVAELDKMRKADVTATKAFLTKAEDRFRAPYARVEETHPRQCVFFGTTNEDVFLRDATGARRFWPVMVGDIDLAGLEAARDQIFAEAVAAFDAGEQWWPDREFERKVIAPRQAAKYVEDVWTNLVRQYIAESDETRFKIDDLLMSAVGMEAAQMGIVQQKRMADILRRLDCEDIKSHGLKIWITPDDSAHSEKRGTK